MALDSCRLHWTTHMTSCAPRWATMGRPRTHSRLRGPQQGPLHGPLHVSRYRGRCSRPGTRPSPPPRSTLRTTGGVYSPPPHRHRSSHPPALSHQREAPQHRSRMRRGTCLLFPLSFPSPPCLPFCLPLPPLPTFLSLAQTRLPARSRPRHRGRHGPPESCSPLSPHAWLLNGR